MPDEFMQTGGLRYGSSFWVAANATWPFASLTANPTRIEITVSAFVLPKRTFSFTPATVGRIQKKSGILSAGMQFVHTVPDYPPLIVFWTFSYASLAAALTSYGYPVEG